MTWNPERYREKRERVLAGNRRKGSRLMKGMLMAGVAVMVMGLWVVAPGAWETFSSRHLDDVIIKVAGKGELGPLVEDHSGVKSVFVDQKDRRLVVTFDRRKTAASRIAEALKDRGMNVIVLNTVSHHVGNQQRKAAHEAH